MPRTVLITGTSSGIGKAAVVAFHRRGWQVVATMRDPARAAGFGWPADVLIERLDLNDPASVESALAAAEARFGAVDALVNNAGYGLTGAIETCSPEQVRASFDTNLFGTLTAIRTFLPGMRERNRGVIVNVTSIGGRMTFPFYGYYSAAKYALEAISEGLWHDLHPSAVRVKVVEPGFTQTAFAETGLVMGQTDLPFYRERIARLTERLRQGNTGTTPDVIAECIVRAAEDPGRRLRYHAGLYAGPLLALRRLLPDTWFMELLGRSTEK
jgi:NAD(P)-dependent dehydrogenase (short-subunit alcohol dehydrogenase family)